MASPFVAPHDNSLEAESDVITREIPNNVNLLYTLVWLQLHPSLHMMYLFWWVYKQNHGVDIGVPKGAKETHAIGEGGKMHQRDYFGIWGVMIATIGTW
jgi:hypothetical protein